MNKEFKTIFFKNVEITLKLYNLTVPSKLNWKNNIYHKLKFLDPETMSEPFHYVNLALIRAVGVYDLDSGSFLAWISHGSTTLKQKDLLYDRYIKSSMKIEGRFVYSVCHRKQRNSLNQEVWWFVLF